MKQKLKLVLPNKRSALSYLKGEKQFKKEKTIIASVGSTGLFHSLKDFHIYKRYLINRKNGINLKKGRVPSTLYWAVLGTKLWGAWM